MATFTGGCLCRSLRYEADGQPTLMGLCFCADCRKASGSGCIPFMGFPASALRVAGPTLAHTLMHADGREAVRNSCASCGGLVFGGILGASRNHTIYAGSLDNPSLFKPSVAIFVRERAPWAVLPPDLRLFDGLPA